MGLHPRANRGNFGNIFVIDHAGSADQIHIGVQQIDGLLEIVMADGEADVLRSVSADGLQNNIDIDILSGQL